MGKRSLLFICCLSSLFIYSDAAAQGPYCPGFNCNANDVAFNEMFIGDVEGDAVNISFCSPGDTLSDLYLWLAFEVQVQRHGINVVGDVLIDNAYHHSFDTCLGTLSAGIYLTQLEPFPWVCDSDLSGANLLFSWALMPTGCEVCPETLTRCHGVDSLEIIEPKACTLVVQNTADDGWGSLRRANDCVASGDTIVFDTTIVGDTIVLTTAAIYIDKSISLNCEIIPVVRVLSESYRTFEIASGSIVHFSHFRIISGIAQNDTKAIYNSGTLSLEDIDIYPNPLPDPLNSLLVTNQGILILVNGTHIFTQ